MPVLSLPQISSVSARRRRLGITQSQLAKAAHASQSFIAKLETARLDPAYSIASRVFFALDELESASSAVAADVMTAKVHSVRPSEKISFAVAILRKNGISQMPVIDEGNVVGSISERWMLELLSKEDYASILSKKVGDAMDEPFPSVSSRTPVNAVAGLLRYAPAVIVMSGQKVAGIISKSDLLTCPK
jgi:predicted transcriptional regulator